MIGRDRTTVFSYIKDRVWHNINSSSSKYLTKARREVMIKFLLQTILLYVMSMFLVPTSIISTIEKMMNSFWDHGSPIIVVSIRCFKRSY
jgi:hypothetical protein